MRAKRPVRCIGMLAVFALMALAFACKKESAQPTGGQAQATPTAAPVPPPAVAAAKKSIEIPDPQRLAVADVAIAIRINRLDQTIPKVVNLVSAFVPSFSADTIKAQLRAMLRDPALTGLDQGRSIVLCLFALEGRLELSFAALLPVNNEKYKTSFEGTGSFVYQEPDGKTLLLAGDEAVVVIGRGFFTRLEAFMFQPAKGEVSVYVNVELLMSRYGALIDAGIAGIIRNMQQEMQVGGKQPPRWALGVASFAMSAYAIREAAKELKDVEFTLALNRDGVEVSTLVRAKEGSLLAAALHRDHVSDMSFQGYVPGKGAIVGFVGGDRAAGRAFFENIRNKVVAKIPVPPNSTFNPEKMKEVFLLPPAGLDAVAFDRFSPGPKGAITGTIIYKTRNPEVFMQSLMQTSMQSMSSVKELVESSGRQDAVNMQIEYKENARNYKGTPVHTYTQSGGVVMAGMTGAAETAILSLLMDVVLNQTGELAIVDSFVVHTMGGTKIEPIIDALKARRPLGQDLLSAQAILPEGDLYMDIHPGRFVGFVLNHLPAFIPQAAQVVPRLNALKVKPISIAGAVYQGKAQLKLSIPLQSILQTRNVVLQTPGQGMAP